MRIKMSRGAGSRSAGQNKSLDGLSKANIKRIHQPLTYRPPGIKVDSIIRRKAEVHPKPVVPTYNKPSYYVPPVRPAFRGLEVLKIGQNFKRAFGEFKDYLNFQKLAKKWDWLYSQQRVPVMVAVVALFVAFGGGVWATLSTSKSDADQPQVLGAFTDQPKSAEFQTSVSLGPINNVPNDVLFNMTISQLENYLASAAITPEAKEAKLLAERKEKLRIYLAEKQSPLADIVDTIAELKHWELVLAISNSESSLGKRCYNNNCSGIGVEPGHPLWRDYKTKADWAKDLDRLLDKRYQGWTLDEMNGTYNKPGSVNWLYASKQILADLQARNIN